MGEGEPKPMDEGFVDRSTEHEVDDGVASGEGLTDEELEELRQARTAETEQPEE